LRRHGFTLIETLLSATLVLLVFGLGSHFLIPLMKMQVKGSERAELQQRCTIAVEELRHDLALTSAGGVSLVQSSEELLLGIHPLDNLAQDGTLVWCDTLIVYSWKRSDRVWRRSTWADSGRHVLRAAAPTRLSEPALRQALAESLTTRETGGVEEALIDLPGALVSLPFTVDFKFTSPSGETRELVRVLGGRLPTL
jgi:hypothetical protein